MSKHNLTVVDDSKTMAAASSRSMLREFDAFVEAVDELVAVRLDGSLDLGGPLPGTTDAWIVRTTGPNFRSTKACTAARMSGKYGGHNASNTPSSPTGFGMVHRSSWTKRNPSPSMPSSANAPRMLQRFSPV